MPADVVDREALRTYLADTDIFGPAVEEAHGYLTDALDRFRITVALLPELPPGARVLELGANPYFLTRLLVRRGYKVTCANYFGDQYAGEHVQVVSGARTGERHAFEFDHFNIERERFPYEDASFDLVLCCEILEHLPSDPVHTLAEIHRVLAQPHGTLLLTTPNATRTTNLVRIIQGDNPYEDLSGYGTYGRHNREYTVRELRDLLEALGYAVDDVFAVDIHDDVPALPAVPDLDPVDRGDNLFALACPEGEARWRYPTWLYSSTHAVRRVVSPDFRAGHNDEMQGTGFYPAEKLEGAWACWMGAADWADVTIEAPIDGAATVVVEGLAPPALVPGPIALEVTVGSQASSHAIACDGQPFLLRVPAVVNQGEITVGFSVTPQWTPAGAGINEDHRPLGVALRRVAVEPGP
jgi:SAM-dependent methyltransferase